MSKRRSVQAGIILLTVLMLIIWFISGFQDREMNPWTDAKSGHISKTFEINNRHRLVPPLKAEKTLWIAATSDLHGSLTSEQLILKKHPQGLLHVAPIIYEIRKQHPELILLDAGDTIQGGPTNFYYSHLQAVSEKPLPLIQIMNELKYDALTLGNHDFETPIKILKQNIKLSQFPWLAANVLKTHNQELLLPPYTIIERHGIRVGILGITTPGIPLWIDPEQIKGLLFKDMLKTAKRWIKVLKNREKVDFLIGLFHSGDNTHYDFKVALGQQLPIPNASGLIADHYPEFDLIIAGHSHKTFPRKKTEYLNAHQTPVILPGTAAQGLSLIQVHFQEYNGRWKILKNVYDYKKARKQLDENLLKKIQPQLEKVKNYLQNPTSIILKKIQPEKEFIKCSSDLSHQVTQKYQTSTLSLLPPWSIKNRNHQFELGKTLTRRVLFKWIPYDNRLVLAHLFGRQIEILLQPFYRKQMGRYARSSTILMAGGFMVDILKDDPKKKMVLRNADGQLIQAEKKYPVWLTNYHWNGGGGMSSKALFQPSQLLKKEEKHFREMLYDYLKNPNLVLPKSCEDFFA